mmetsp:Transcript_8774/g.38711  ORF Transcript_8774/g.38711 Transcript_8774/m.38711 type:complete len:299 (-) Transcript_8774:542-1438(-)
MRTPARRALRPGLPIDGHRVAAGEASRGCAHVRRRARRAARLRRVHRVPGIVNGPAPRVWRVQPAGEPVQGHAGGGGQVGGAAHRRARRRRRGRRTRGGSREVRGAARQGERAAGAVRGVRPRRVQGVARAPALRRSASRRRRVTPRGGSRRSRRRRHGPGPRRSPNEGSRDDGARVHGARGAGHALARGFVPHGDPAGETRRRRERVRKYREDAPVCPPRAGVPGSGVRARGEANADLPQVPRVSAAAPRGGGGGHAGGDERFQSVARESSGAQVLPGVFLPPLVHAVRWRDGGAEG